MDPTATVLNFRVPRRSFSAALGAFVLLSAASTFAADRINGQVLGAGAPIVGSTVTLWAAGAGTPQQLGQTQTDADGRFVLSADGKGAILYLVAKGGRPAANKAGGDNPAIALLAVLGSTAPNKVVVSEMTTVASVWTNAQFLDGAAIKGNPLGLQIAAGNVPNFVDLETGGYGGTIQDALNSGHSPTMANFATLPTVLAGCVTQVKPDACGRFFTATTPRSGKAPTDTLTALEGVARDSSYQPERLFALLDAFYPSRRAKPSGRPRSCRTSLGLRSPGSCRSNSPAGV